MSSGLGYPAVAPIRVVTASVHRQLVQLTMAAPWIDGRSGLLNLSIYLPPNFDPRAQVGYQVIYELPYEISSWTQLGRFNLPATLEDLVARHLVPPEIVVFLGMSGGPYKDSECANSYDRWSHIEPWIVSTMVPWVDAHYPTIASRTGRAVMGASQGGSCAAALWSHHPDIFGAAPIESGYFMSGVRPAFMPTLDAARVPYRLYADPVGHSWVGFARETPRMLVELALWMNARGVP